MKLIKLLRDKRGDITYTDTAIATLVIMIVVAMALNVFSFFTLRQNLEYFCEQLIEEAACDGRIDDGVPERFIELCAELGFDEGDVSYSFDGSQFAGSGRSKIQYGDTITVTVTYRTSLGGTGIFTLPAALSCSSSGLSEKYWKS